MIRTIKAFGAGFLLGIFLAPRSGAASRRLLMDWLTGFCESGQRRFEELEDDLAARRRAGDESMVAEPESGSGL